MSDLPIELDVDIDGLQATEAFKVLGNETRLRILLALWEAENPLGEDPPNPMARTELAFSELREQVLTEPSSNFSYHLEQLLGGFVTKSEHGYELLPAGERLVQAIIASAGFVEQTLQPVPIDVPCPECGSATAITYQRQRLYHVCGECEGIFDMGEPHPSGLLGGWISDPSIMTRGSGEAVHDAVRTEVFHLFGMRAAGICPRCLGRVGWTLHVCEDHAADADGACPTCQREFRAIGEFACSECKNQGIVPPFALALRHPAVISFFWEHDIALGYDSDNTARSTLEYHRSETEVISMDPPRVRVTWSLEGDDISLTYDEALTVVGVNGEG